MTGAHSMKRAIKRSAGYAAVMTRPWQSRTVEPQACILVYHRVAPLGFIDSAVDDWNVPPATFERQVAALTEHFEIVPLMEMMSRVDRWQSDDKPLVSLTFDDGYANFFTEALSILERYQAPAALGVVTGIVGHDGPVPFDRWSQRHYARVPADCCRPVTWSELDQVVASGLVTLVSHSHRHRKGTEATPTELAEEASVSREILASRYGAEHAAAYIYPYGCSQLGYVPPNYRNAAQQAGYRLAATTDVGMVRKDIDWFRCPRIEAHAVDSPAVIHAKAAGCLGPYRLIDHLRRRNRGR